MAKLRILTEPEKDYKKERYHDLCIHRKNKKFKKIIIILSLILTTSIALNIYFYNLPT